MADEQHKSIVSTLYQAGNGIFDQFDKVLVLAEGREIYYGLRSKAKGYFEEMGFVCAPGANIADFLTSVAVHTERTVAPGYEDSVPNTASEFEARYKQSRLFGDMVNETLSVMDDHSLHGEIQGLKQARHLEKKRRFAFLSRETSPYTVSFFRQVVACTKRYAHSPCTSINPNR